MRNRYRDAQVLVLLDQLSHFAAPGQRGAAGHPVQTAKRCVAGVDVLTDRWTPA